MSTPINSYDLDDFDGPTIDFIDGALTPDTFVPDRCRASEQVLRAYYEDRRRLKIPDHCAYIIFVLAKEFQNAGDSIGLVTLVFSAD